MSINYLSPMLTQQLEKQAKGNVDSIVKVNPSQKPDTVYFSGKKVARNTGFAAIFGGILGTVKSIFQPKDSITTKQNIPIEEQVAQKALNELRARARDILDKINQGKELSKEEADIAHIFKFDNPLIRYLFKNDANILEGMKTMFKDISRGDELAYMSIGSYRKEGLNKINSSFLPFFRQAVLDHLNGTKDNSELFNILSDDSYNFTRTCKLSDYIKECSPKSESEAINCWNQIYCDMINPLGPIKDVCANEDELIEVHKNLTKDRIAELIESAKQQANNTKSQLLNKQTLKSAGIGAVIAGGIALAGSLIYKALKANNVKENQSKQ